MTSSRLRVARVSPGLTWRAFEDDVAVGSITAFLRPDNRWIAWFGMGAHDSDAELVDAVVADVRAELHANAEEDDCEGQARLAALGFEPRRREGTYLIPTDPRLTGLEGLIPGDDVVIISAGDADEEYLRLLDAALRQDVPGADGWEWDPGDFREETYEAADFDPATYLIAVDKDSGQYIGLARVWMNPGRPRLGLIGVLGPYRRRGIARVLLGKAFGVLHERGLAQVAAEIDDTAVASLALLTGIGARRNGGTIEYVLPVSLP